MTIEFGKVEPYFDNPATENKDGSTFVQRFHVPLLNVIGSSAMELSLIEGRAKRAQGVPLYGHVYPGNNAAFCQVIKSNVISDQTKNIPTHVIVSCTFSTKPVNKRDEEEDPLKKSPDIIWGEFTEKVTLTNARRLTVFQGKTRGATLKGEPIANSPFNKINQYSLGITNSALDPFKPGIQRDVFWDTVTIVQNISRDDWDPEENSKLKGTVNKAKIVVDGFKIPAKNAFLKSRTARIMYQGKLSYRQVTTTLIIKNTHAVIVQDTGFQKLVEKLPTVPGLQQGPPSTEFGGTEDFKKIPIKTNAKKVPVEQPLDGLGNALKKGEEIVYSHWDVYEREDFKLLKLPTEKL